MQLVAQLSKCTASAASLLQHLRCQLGGRLLALQRKGGALANLRRIMARQVSSHE